MKIIQLVMVMTALLVSACAPHRVTPVEQAAPVSAALSGQDAAMIRFASEGMPGSSAVFSGTSLGTEVNVTVGHNYTSALNQECKEARVTSLGISRKIAICRGTDGIWSLAPDIFASGEF